MAADAVVVVVVVELLAVVLVAVAPGLLLLVVLCDELLFGSDDEGAVEVVGALTFPLLDFSPFSPCNKKQKQIKYAIIYHRKRNYIINVPYVCTICLTFCSTR